MRVLIVAGSFAGPNRQPWLLDDLAAALVRAGHLVDVLVLDATNPRPRGKASSSDARLSVFSVGTTKAPKGRIGKLASYLATGVRAHTQGFAWVRKNRYDLCFYTSIASFRMGAPGRIRRAGITKRLTLTLWDFFPVHQFKIGRVNARRLAGVMKYVERKAIEPADVVAVMTPANERFLKTYHKGVKSSTVVVPPWSDATPELTREAKVNSLAETRLRVVFGGQLALGRGVDSLSGSSELSVG